MGTNATLVTAAMAKDLVRSGLCSSIVSIEGDEKTHDLIRGNGSYKRALAGLINLMDQGIDVRINMVLMKSNISSIVSVLELSSKLNIPIFLRRFVPSGRGMENQGEVLTANDYEKLRMDLEKYLLEPRGLVQGHYLAEKKAEIRASLPFTRYSCSAGQRGIIITPNGHVHTCGFLAMLGEKVLGKTPEEEISIIWKRLTESNHMEFLRKKLDLHNAGNEQIVTNCLAIPKIYR
ncbi:MAG: radical SAM protein [uncultured bacterium]|nr:MAG: radical SAM protein [uncultured bacterium]